MERNRSIEARTRQALPHWLALAAMLALAACTTVPKPEPATQAPREAPADAAVTPPAEPVPTARLITYQTPAVKAYRKTGAGHIYKQYPKRIYQGKIPPLVYAVVVVETHLDANGKVTNVTFSRTPGHAPEVAPKIAALIREASPLPSPGKLGAHTYVDTWLWDKGGNFQLDTLTKGQRSR